MTPLAEAQPTFYYAGMTEEENAEVRAWAVHYWTRVDNGGGSPGTGFAFTENPLMNSQLFNPIRAVRPTLEQLHSGLTSVCDRMYELPTGLDQATQEWRAMIKNAMLYGEIEAEEGSPEEWELLLLIEAAPWDYPYLAWDENGYLITLDLPLSEVSGVAADAALALEVSPESEAIIATLIGAGGYWRNQCSDIPQWRSLITGETSTAEQFRGLVESYLQVRDEQTYTTLLQASFGCFGELPVVVTFLNDCFIFIDPTNGNLSGPFELGSAIDASGLLSQHCGAYQAGTAIRYYNWLGSPVSTGTLTDVIGNCIEQQFVGGLACDQNTVGTLKCDTVGQQRCSCIQDGTSYKWNCSPCPAGKVCRVGQTPSTGAPRLSCVNP